MSLSRGVKIAGYGCVCACGNSAADAFDGALKGRACFGLPAHRVHSSYTDTYPVFMVSDDFLAARNPEQSISQFLFIACANEAFAQAGITPEQLRAKRVGVVVGSSVDASFHCFDVYRHWRKGEFSAQDARELKNYLALPTAQTISRHFGFTGPFQTIVTACASGTDAVGMAKSWIDTGLCDAVLCGGTDEISLSPYDGFIRLMVAGKERCKPFSKNRAGINVGEGAGAFLLVSHATAEEFNLHAQGYVLGYGNACDAYHQTAPDPEAKGLIKAINFALQEAGLTADDLAFINAHGTASAANDPAEGVAFRTLCPQVPVWGSKGVTGHTLGAAGAVEAVLTLEALNKKIVPPTVGFEQYDENIGFTPTTQVTAITKRFALSDSLAFGGCNAAIVLGAQDAA